MNKKTKSVIIALIVIVLALGCGSIGLVAADRHIEAAESTSLSAESTNENSEGHADNQSDTDSGNTAKSDNSDSGKANASSSNKKASSDNSSQKSGGNKSQSGTGGSSKSNDKSTPSTAKPQQTTTVAKKTYTCTVTIDCSVILDNMGNLTEGKEAYVPSNGCILKSYTIKAQEGESVYSLLQRACRANGIPYNAEDKGIGKYVSSINNLAEKDCGSNSGWIYTVNGKFINRTCEKEKIKSNSTIIWKYVV